MRKRANADKIKDNATREELARKDILATMRSLIERYGYHKITLDDIANALGKTKGFLYYYYPDKDAILAAAIEAESIEMQKTIDSALEKETNGLAKIRTFILICHQEIQKRQSILARLRNEINGKGSQDTLRLLLEKSGELMKTDSPLLRSLLRSGMKDGSLRTLQKEKIEAFTYLISLILRGIEYDYIMGNADEHSEERLRISLDALLHGIAVIQPKPRFES